MSASAQRSPAWERWTSVSSALASASSSKPRSIPSAEPSSPSTGPRSNGTKTSGMFAGNQRREWREMPVAPAVQGSNGMTQAAVWMESAEDLPVRTSASPDDEPAWEASDPDSSTSLLALPMSLFDPGDGSSLRTSPACSVPTMDEISPSFCVRWATSGFTTSPGECWTAVTSECPSDGDASSSLPDVLLPAPMVPERFYLSPKAAVGILRRAATRRRILPAALSQALWDLSLAASEDDPTAATDSELTRSPEDTWLPLWTSDSAGVDDNEAQGGQLVTRRAHPREQATVGRRHRDVRYDG